MMLSKRILGLATRRCSTINTSLPKPCAPSPVNRGYRISAVQTAYRRFGDPPKGAAAGSPIGALSNILNSKTYGKASQASHFRRPPTLILVLVGGGGVYYLFHLEKVEATGRWRFMDVSPKTEVEMGQQGFAEIMNEFKGKLLPQNHPTSRYVQNIVKRIVRANDLSAGPDGWQTFVVADSGTRNAFVLPGGKIFVFTGILPVAADADGLAVILGHEIAHQVARHSAERLSYTKVLFALSILLDSLGLDIGISRILLNLLLSLPNSRKAESEADYIGLQLATQACYDPRAATSLWQRMDKAEGGGGKNGSVNVDFLSTHPASSKRVEKVTVWAEEIIRNRPESCGPLERQIGAFRGEVMRPQW